MQRDNLTLIEKKVMSIMGEIITDNISNEKYFVKYVKKMNITVYNSTVYRIGEKFPKYYEYYLKSLEYNKALVRERLKSIILYMGSLISYGVELEDGTFRKFDEFDWYIIKDKYFDNLGRTEISNIFDELRKEYFDIPSIMNLNSTRIIVGKSYATNPYNYSDLINAEYILNDYQSKLTYEERKKLLDFMKKYGVILNYKNYEIGTQKMLAQRNHEDNLFSINLHIDENDIKKRVRK